MGENRGSGRRNRHSACAGFGSEPADLHSEPDALFVACAAITDGRVERQEKGFDGPVEMVLEVISPSSRRKDRDRLYRAYSRAGIREYWLVDALGDTVQLELHVAADDGYRRQPEVDGFVESPVFGSAFRLERTEDPTGGEAYVLRVR